MTDVIARRCPSCSHKPLRVFEHHLVCDACNGMLMPAGDFEAAVHEIDHACGLLGFDDAREAGKPCPCCGDAMSEATVRRSTGARRMACGSTTTSSRTPCITRARGHP